MRITLLLAAAVVVSIICAIVIKWMRVAYKRNKSIPMKHILNATSEHIITKSMEYGIDENGKRELDTCNIIIGNMDIRFAELMEARRGVDEMMIYINPVREVFARDSKGNRITSKPENKFIGKTIRAGESATIRILIRKIDEITTPIINMEEI